MARIKDAMQDFDDSGYISKEDEERLTFEKRQAEGDDREGDIANGWEPSI